MNLPDRIVFYNPGRLMPGLSLDKLFSNNYTSTPRNKLVANIFKDIGLIEKYGSGIRRIREGILNWGLAAPKIVDDEGGFTVTVYRASQRTNYCHG